MADRWMTYEEAGELFGLSAEAMRKRCRRLGWRIQPGNDNQTRTRILVPDNAEIRPAGQAPGRPAGDHREGWPNNRPVDPVEMGLVDQKDGYSELVVELRSRAENAERRADRAENERDTLATELIRERERGAKAQGEARALREALMHERQRVEGAEEDRAAAERARQWAEDMVREAHHRLQLERQGQQDARARETRRLEQAEAALKMAETQRDAAQAARDATQVELAGWTVGGPLARAWRGFWRGRTG